MRTLFGLGAAGTSATTGSIMASAPVLAGLPSAILTVMADLSDLLDLWYAGRFGELCSGCAWAPVSSQAVFLALVVALVVALVLCLVCVAPGWMAGRTLSPASVAKSGVPNWLCGVACVLSSANCVVSDEGV